ncbi:MAG: M20/M25/M40 family metallo-hydrolase [Pygmaiobacter massiliensis]|nr:M20/M25/M40 family metallo-hydrolase [Pygmaiobacter massiliensis]
MMTAKEICRVVEENRQECIDCLVELLQTPSTTTQEVEISKVFSRRIEQAGIPVTIHAISPEHPNVFGEWFGSQPGKRFIFNGHMDAFPPVEGDSGLYGPFSGKVADGYIYGRGAADMKGGDAAALMAVTLLKRMGFDPKGSVLLSFMCDEEIGGRYGAKWLAPQGLLDGDFGICMEPSDGRVLAGHSGILRLWFTYTAPAAHACRHHPTKNALEKCVLAINALMQYRENVVKQYPADPWYGGPSLSITTLHAGEATNVHAAQGRFSVDYRMVPGQTHQAVLAQLCQVLDGLASEDPEMTYTYEIISDRPVLDVDENSPIIKACCEAYQEVTGKQAVVARRHGGSDAATIAAYNGIPMPNWGAANDTVEPTSPNEKIAVEDYLQSIAYYMLTVVKMMQ